MDAWEERILLLIALAILLLIICIGNLIPERPLQSIKGKTLLQKLPKEPRLPGDITISEIEPKGK